MSVGPSAVQISVVVPVYNSESTLPTLVERLTHVLTATGSTYEILLVNDGSRDGSWAVVQGLARADPRVLGFDLARNYGQHNATLCGIRLARGAAIVTIDDDLQNRPEDIPALLDMLAQGYDLVYATPIRRRWDPLRNVASHVMKLALRTTVAAATAEIASGFRAFRSGVRTAFANYEGRSSNVDVLLTWGVSRVGAVKVQHQPRTSGRSGYSYYRLFVHTWNMATGFSTLPLQVATGIGFLFTLFGIAVLAFVITKYINSGGAVVQGFTFLASLIAIFAGAQLFALGIIGEYLGRMFQRTSGEPTYLVRRSTNEAVDRQ